MPRSVCSIEECEGLVNAHGLCPKHYMRMRRHGDPHINRNRFYPRVLIASSVQEACRKLDEYVNADA